MTAGLKAPDDDKDGDKKDVPAGANGNGSLYSGNSIVTISSQAVLDPDEEHHKIPNDLEDERDIRKEKWYHTILQVSIPFFVAGMGTIGAGRVLTIAKVRAPRRRRSGRETGLISSKYFINISFIFYFHN